MLSRTTNLLPLLSMHVQIDTHPGNVDIWTIYHSLPLISVMYEVLTTLLQTHFHVLKPMPSFKTPHLLWINFLVMAKAQRTELQKLLSNPEQSSLQLTELTLYTRDITLFCDISQVFPDHLSQPPYGKLCLTLSIPCHTLVYKLPNTCLLPDTSGQQ